VIPYRYCPFCATELQTRRIPEDGPERRVCSACGFIQWGNSKPTSAGIILDGRGRVLLGRRNIEPFRGWWDLPGGFLEVAEHPEDGLRREIREECGIEVTDLRFVGVFLDVYPDKVSEATHDLLNFYYECRAAGTPVGADDIEDLLWFPPGEVPVDEVAFAANRAALRAWLADSHKGTATRGDE
jgi:ADP-ribose pyrophosphatase YjhB (NUDIX family)